MILCICPNPSVDTFVWLDDLRPGAINRIQNEQRFPGGKGVHVALAVAELGEEVELLGFWGGATGNWIRESCMAMGVTCHGPEVQEWSRTCMTFKSTGLYNETELLGGGPSISRAHYNGFLDIFIKLLPRARVLCLSGSWPQGAGSDASAHLIRMARVEQKTTLLDTTGDQLRLALEERPSLVHLNRSEIQALFNSDNIVENAIQLSRHCDYPAVTVGAEGLYLVHDKRIFHAQCAIDKVYSAVGSGDCLLAGLAVGFIRNMTPDEAAKLGVACGAANCLREELGMLHRKDVEMLMSRATVITSAIVK